MNLILVLFLEPCRLTEPLAGPLLVTNGNGALSSWADLLGPVGMWVGVVVLGSVALARMALRATYRLRSPRRYSPPAPPSWTDSSQLAEELRDRSGEAEATSAPLEAALGGVAVLVGLAVGTALVAVAVAAVLELLAGKLA